MVIGLSEAQFKKQFGEIWNFKLGAWLPWIVRHEVLLPINWVNKKVRES